MAKVTKKAKALLKEYIETLPDEETNKCTMCNETLTHLVKKAEAETKAPTATVARALAKKVNEGAAEVDKVNGKALLFRVRNHEGRRKVANGNNKHYALFDAAIKEAEKDSTYEWTNSRAKELSDSISNVVSGTIKMSCTTECGKMLKTLQKMKNKPDFKAMADQTETKFNMHETKLTEALEQFGKFRKSLKSII